MKIMGLQFGKCLHICSGLSTAFALITFNPFPRGKPVFWCIFKDAHFIAYIWLTVNVKLFHFMEYFCYIVPSYPWLYSSVNLYQDCKLLGVTLAQQRNSSFVYSFFFLAIHQPSFITRSDFDHAILIEDMLIFINKFSLHIIHVNMWWWSMYNLKKNFQSHSSFPEGWSKDLRYQFLVCLSCFFYCDYFFITYKKQYSKQDALMVIIIFLRRSHQPIRQILPTLVTVIRWALALYCLLISFPHLLWKFLHHLYGHMLSEYACNICCMPLVFLCKINTVLNIQFLKCHTPVVVCCAWNIHPNI